MEDLKLIRNMLNEEIEKLERKRENDLAKKSESIKNLERDLNKLINYTVHEFMTGYGIKKQKDIISGLFNIVKDQNSKIINLENKLIESKEKI